MRRRPTGLSVMTPIVGKCRKRRASEIFLQTFSVFEIVRQIFAFPSPDRFKSRRRKLKSIVPRENCVH
jgi:hypothetical protein